MAGICRNGATQGFYLQYFLSGISLSFLLPHVLQRNDFFHPVYVGFDIGFAKGSSFAGSSCGMLTLCRTTGIVFSAGLGLWILADSGWFRILKEKEKIKQILALLAAPAALVMWMVYLHFHCGDAMAFSHTQSAWGHAYTWPWESFFAGGQWYQQAMSVYVMILVGLTIMLFRKAGTGEKLFVVVNVLFPLITGTVASFYRYFSVIPQFFVRFFNLLESRWKWVVCICILINLILYYVWISVLSPRPEAWLTY